MSDRKREKARESGFYTVGTGQFYLHKGDFVPEDAENVFYDEPEETVTAEDNLAARMVAQENAVDEDVETTSDNELVDKKGNTLLTTSDDAPALTVSHSILGQANKVTTKSKGK